MVLNTSLSASVELASPADPDGCLRCCRTRDPWTPTPIAQSKILALRPPWPCAVRVTLARTFSKIRGAPPMNVGLTTRQVLHDLGQVAVDGGGEARSRNWTAESTLPSTWDSGSHRYCTSSGPEDAEAATAVALVDPVVVDQPDALGLAGGARGVDQGRQILRAAVPAIRSSTTSGSLREQRRTAGGQVVQGENRASSGSDCRRTARSPSGRAGRQSWTLCGLLGVLGEHDDGFRVGQDVGDVGCGRGRVHGGGRGARAQDGQVGQDPVDPGRTTRSPPAAADATPSSTRPAARSKTRSLVCAQRQRRPLVPDPVAEGLALGGLARPAPRTDARTTGARSVSEAVVAVMTRPPRRPDDVRRPERRPSRRQCAAGDGERPVCQRLYVAPVTTVPAADNRDAYRRRERFGQPSSSRATGSTRRQVGPGVDPTPAPTRAKRPMDLVGAAEDQRVRVSAAG